MDPAVVAELPDMGIRIALVASHWSRLEQKLGSMYTCLLGGEETSSFEFYHDLVDMSLKEKAFMAAAKSQLDDSIICEVTRLYVEVRNASKRRANVIHGTWCSTPSKPNSLLLAEQRNVGRKINEAFKYIRDVKKGTTKGDTPRSFDLCPDEYIEYTIKDFDDIISRIKELSIKSEEIGNKILSASITRVAKSPH